MKRLISSAALLLAVIGGVRAQETPRFSVATTLGTAIALSTPASTPFAWQVTGYYNFNPRWSAGIGSGVSVYEKTLIPLFAEVKFHIIRPHRFTPWVACAAGWGFATSRAANGGMHLNPSIGVQWAAFSQVKLLFAVGYEWQSMERLKQAANPYFTAEFAEQLDHKAISIKVGVLF